MEDKEQRKLVLAAVKKAGYKGGPAVKDPASAAASPAAALAKPSALSSVRVCSVKWLHARSELTTVMQKKPSPKKRKRDSDVNEFLPKGPPDEDAAYGSLEFNEQLDEEVGAPSSHYFASCSSHAPLNPGPHDEERGCEPRTGYDSVGDGRRGAHGVQARRGT
jgi:hypothetical protein